MIAAMACLLLIGPYPGSDAALAIHVHLGTDRRSRQAASELRCTDLWHFEQRMAIEKNFRIVVHEDEWKDPSYSIGRSPERFRFRPGTFVASGTFLLSLRYITDEDVWQRREHDTRWVRQLDGEYEVIQDQSDRPIPFPPYPPSP